MRKKGWLAIVIAFCFLLAGCGSSSANTTVEEGKDSPTQTQTEMQTDAQTEAVGDSSTLEERKEKYPYHQSGEMKEHIAQYGTVLESWFPLGGRGNTQTLFNDETISSIAEAHGVSSAQAIIRWHLQAGNICIPGSSNEQHIIEDYDVWDFELTEEEMAQMTALEKDDRFADY